MITNYVSIDSVIERLNRDYIPGTYWNIEELKEWTYEALSKIDKNISNVAVTSIIEILDGKAKIPAEVELIDRITIYENTGETEILELRPGQDLDNYTYVINQGFIHVKFGSGRLKLYYFTTPIDLEGRPMIPDTEYYKSAIVAYLQYMIGKRAYWAGKILERQLTMLEQEWSFYNNAAKNEQRMKSFMNSKRFRKINNKYLL